MAVPRDSSAHAFPSEGRAEGRPVDTDELAAALDGFSSTVTRDFDVTDILRQLALCATRVLDVAGAGVSVPGSDGRLLRLVFATGGPVAELEQLQDSLQEGPCRVSHESGEIVNLADVAEEGAWPRFQRRAVELGLRAAAAVPLRARGRRWGVLDVYRSEPLALSKDELSAATTLANLATSYLVVTHDRDAAREAQTELAERAMRDMLTGLPVRWVFLEQLAHALHRLRRTSTHAAVLFLDLDGLKYVNDTYGHLAGDRLIVTSVERIRAALRPSDLLARIGGDELVVLLEDLERPEDAAVVAQRILDSLAQPFRAERHLIRPSASIGIAHTDDPETKGAALIAHADSAMYHAKRAKRGRFEVFSPERYASERADAAAAERLARELPSAIRTRQLEVHYQPILDLAEPEAPAYAVEALVRWRHPRRGLLTAGGFVDIAERGGLLPALGAWVMETACRQLADWDREHPGSAPGRLFVNLSTVELTEPRLAEGIRRSLQGAGLDPRRLTIEITETGLLHDAQLAAAALRPLREMGCELAIDDFGTGYSSLSRLIDIPASVIKIDQAFTRQLGRDDNAAAVIAAVHNLGQTLGRTVVAEGVEDEATLAELRRLGVRYAQGFHLGVPMAADDLAAGWDVTR